MRSDPTVLASTTHAVLRLAEREGLDRRRLLARAEVDPALLADGRTRISRDVDAAIWTAIERELGDDTFGLRYLDGLTADAFGALGFFAMSSATIGEAIARGVRFQHVVKDDIRVRTREEGRRLVLDQLIPSGNRAWTRPVTDHALGTYVALARRWSGQPISPNEVRIQHPRPSRAGAYEAFFGCPVRFGAEVPGLTFDRDVLDLPLKTAQPEIEGYLTNVVEEAARALRPRDFEAEVRSAIAFRLGEQLSLRNVARDVGASGRTLQRHLGAHGLSFHALVEDVRRARALELLASTNLPIDAIGEQLGYSEGSAFRRACRRWTGAPPAMLRRRARS